MSCFCPDAGIDQIPSKASATNISSLNDATVLECDYDENVTTLYGAIESKAWVAVFEFLETGEWDHRFTRDPQPPSRQARTWVTRFNPDGSVRWSQLPLHAAIIFGAPRDVIVKLLDLYPLGIRCTNDKQMLPLHLAIKFGSDDTVLTVLIEKFPVGLSTKDEKGRTPLDISNGPAEFWRRRELLKTTVEVTKETICQSQRKLYENKIQDLQEDLNVQAHRVNHLKNEKTELEAKLLHQMKDYSELQAKYSTMKQQQAVLSLQKQGNGNQQANQTHQQRQLSSSLSPPSPSRRRPIPEMKQEQHPQQNLLLRPPVDKSSRRMHRQMMMLDDDGTSSIFDKNNFPPVHEKKQQQMPEPTVRDRLPNDKSHSKQMYREMMKMVKDDDSSSSFDKNNFFHGV